MASNTRRLRRQNARQEQSVPNSVADSYQNFETRVGVGADNAFSAGTYSVNPISRNRQLLESMYRGSWIVGAAVDAYSDDMTRAGIEFTANVEPDDAEKLQSVFDRLQLWSEIGDAIRWSRLYGGCICVLLIDGQDYSTPLRVDTVGPGQFQGLLAIDRWQLQPTVGDVVTDLGPHFGKPQSYTVISAGAGGGLLLANPLFGKKIHHSRVFRFEGIPLPFYQRVAEQGWGMSVIERLYDRLLAFDSATQGSAQLVHKAHLRTLSVEGLTTILGGVGGDAAFKALLKRVEQIRRFQTSEGLTLIDAKDKLEHYNYTFSGLSDMVMQFGEQISGALQIPLVRLFGQSPAGLNSSGESDLRTYYDGIKREQEKVLREALTKLIRIIYRSNLKRDADPGFAFKFSPLWQMSDKEKADTATAVTAPILSAFESGVIDRATALKELRKSADATGVFSNITDEDITAAEEEPPVPGEMGMPPGMDPGAPGAPGGPENNFATMPGKPENPGETQEPDQEEELPLREAAE